jgi:hypothetical protein
LYSFAGCKYEKIYKRRHTYQEGHESNKDNQIKIKINTAQETTAKEFSLATMCIGYEECGNKP